MTFAADGGEPTDPPGLEAFREGLEEGSSTTFTLQPGEEGPRLDVFLAARLSFSRARIQQGIQAGEVLVNGRTVRPSYKLRKGDLVETELTEVLVPSLVAEDIPLSVLFEDHDLTVINKPPGMVVHPAGDITGGTLANALAHRFGAEPGLVHRLDRDTSGLMVVARTEAAKEALTAQFRSREVTKHYVALVYGRLAAPRGTIAVPLNRDRKNRLKMVPCAAGEGREALTLYEVREQWAEFALLDVEIKTGRTHQIRVHCAHLGHPVVADEMYGKGRSDQIQDPRSRAAVQELGRQFLHAARLSFVHPRTGVRLEFEAPLPPDLSAMVATLRE